MPSRSITAREGVLGTEVIDTTSGIPTSSNATRSASRAASVARPRPQAERASRHPTSTQGLNGRSCVGTASPVMPTSWPVSCRSSAHSPQPCSSRAASIRSSIASDCSRVRVSGK